MECYLEDMFAGTWAFETIARPFDYHPHPATPTMPTPFEQFAMALFEIGTGFRLLLSSSFSITNLFWHTFMDQLQDGIPIALMLFGLVAVGIIPQLISKDGKWHPRPRVWSLISSGVLSWLYQVFFLCLGAGCLLLFAACAMKMGSVPQKVARVNPTAEELGVRGLVFFWFAILFQEAARALSAREDVVADVQILRRLVFYECGPRYFTAARESCYKLATKTRKQVELWAADKMARLRKVISPLRPQPVTDDGDAPSTRNTTTSPEPERYTEEDAGINGKPTSVSDQEISDAMSLNDYDEEVLYTPSSSSDSMDSGSSTYSLCKFLHLIPGTLSDLEVIV
ncbi:hypothetical protein BT63DRAFT_438210 [Microthyrium microscopicum]|uniref:Uncharacterized protein n=1 Tax=Microthyrium microscopicum TaxID=703497 RepID=A0A6A6UND4_9PEZI|nr:hypothetical protein BT63DRAFT_438210 [Microthyrium microscopicum]